jgi:hypothetical protein
MPATGHQAAGMALDDGRRPKAIVFDLEQPIGMVKRLRDADERHWPVVHASNLSLWRSGR